MPKTNLFKKVLLILWILLTPLTLMFMYFNKVSIGVVREEIETNSRSRLSFYMQRIDSEFDKFVTSIANLNNDPSIQAFTRMEAGASAYTKFQSKLEAGKELSSINYGSWEHSYSLYAINSGETVTTHYSVQYNDYFVKKLREKGYEQFRWSYDAPASPSVRPAFVWWVSEPFSAHNAAMDSNMIAEIRVNTRDLAGLLDEFKGESSGVPFLFHSGDPVIRPANSDNGEIAEISARFLEREELAPEGTFTASVNDVEYMVSYTTSEELEWALIEYVPLEQILQPITSSRKWFWAFLGLLVTLGVLSAYLLYRNIQVPIRKLYVAAKKLEGGSYSYRLPQNRSDEFGYLFEQFNSMTVQIGDLIDRVYAEELRSREATLKQLQSQINPHFLYNCLFFIKNMTRLGEQQAVMAMAVKLGDFFRYTTHVDQQEAALREEIQLVDNYLSIQKMRMKRLTFSITIPEQLHGITVPRLLLQPIVENAIIHGIEPKEGEALIRMEGGRVSVNGRPAYAIVVEDNGAGMEEAALHALRERLQSGQELTESCGLRNVHLRLIHRFGEGSGLVIEHSVLGGLRVTVRWMDQASPPE
ncbi:sensor histidine kinase YesM [Paenibacillus albidus]|uniref:Sensor histidine kinase YesM n=1 Tax=Paenibacillus albidus TaxID=2041023 RepID=A0A917FIR1_9BACL|nr:sensor histidine kinase [Paenibacillus albidus]GGF86062.1 sensor histidine kinase YesM [Paenibacillus albidus]